jgi:hypothetical protein
MARLMVEVQHIKSLPMQFPFVTLTLTLFILATCVCSAAEKTGDLNIQVDFGTGIGTLKALNGVNGGPRTVGRHSGDLVTLHKEAGFPSVRLHDCNWPHPDVVDIPTIFPLFHLDADDPKNYQFAKTDAYIKPIIENGASILFRMGVSIEHKAPRFHVAPPEDFEKWTKICVNILRHYNDGWADGFHYNIRHVEIWNEIATNEMWSGTHREQGIENEGRRSDLPLQPMVVQLPCGGDFVSDGFRE